MNNKILVIGVVCFAVGVALGIAAVRLFKPDSGKQSAKRMRVLRETEIAASGHRAFAAYQHESPAVAINALNRYLEDLKTVPAGPHAIVLTEDVNDFDAMLAHGRLAKLYLAAGQPENGSQHIAEALGFASKDKKLQGVTNEATLLDIVNRCDQAGAK